ncbi:hypothetical protein H4S00_003476 [Coemansia sp. D1744]|nr:hypothetical protein H4S00_003476 [Coemansia sp. D1744]
MDAPGTFARKHSVQGAKWNPAYHAQLQKYVANINYLTGHAYAFARFILLHEVDIDNSIIFKQFGYSFFYDVFLYCAERKDEREAGVEAKVRRAVILSYRDKYVDLSKLKLRKYQPLSAVANYVAKSMLTAYKNNVLLRFGETWRRAVNLKLDTKNKTVDLVNKLERQGKSTDKIREQCQVQIWTPARHAKEVLRSRRPVATTADEQTVISFLTPVLNCYPVGYEFKGDDIYWDCKASPENHVKAFIMLNRCLVAEGYRCIQALPLRRSWVYAHVPINTVILANHIFEEKYCPVTDKQPAVSPDKPAALADKPAVSSDEPGTPADKPRKLKKPPKRYTEEEYWARVVDLKLRSFKDHMCHKFNGYIMTDGVSITVIRKNKEMLATKAAKAADLKRKREEQAQEQPAAQRARLVVQPPMPSQQLLPMPSQQLPLMSLHLPPLPSHLPPLPSQLLLMLSQHMPLPSQQPPMPLHLPPMPLHLPPMPSHLPPLPSHLPPLPSQLLLMLSQHMPLPSQQPPMLSQNMSMPLQQQPPMPMPLQQQPPMPSHLPPLPSQLLPMLSQHMPLPSQQPPMPLQQHPPMPMPLQHLPPMPSHLLPMPSQHMPMPLHLPPMPLHLPPMPSQHMPILSQQPPIPSQQEQPLVQNTRKRRPAQPRQKADCQYIDELPQATLQSTAGQCVLIDPGRRDLLFAMHEDSSIEDKQLYRYTRNQQRKETRVTRFKKILKKVKPADIAEAERSLGAGSCVKPDLKLFKEYLVARAQVADKLTRFYNETHTEHPTSTHQIHMFKTSEPQSFPLHRKLRLSAYINQKQADQRLIKKLQDEFGLNAVIVIGDWSAPMNRFHEPIRGKGWRMLLKRAGFEVYLIKEYLTSKTCPNCNGRLANTRYVPNPRPWKERIQPKVKCHGLLSCQSEECLKSIDKSEGESEDEKEDEKKEKVQRWWNRDLAAVLNFRHILFSLRETGIAPTRFQRKQPTEAPKAPKPRKTTARKPRKAPSPTNNLPAQL